MHWPRPGSLPLASPRALGENVSKHTKEVKPGVSLGSAAAPTWLEMSLRWGIKRTHVGQGHTQNPTFNCLVFLTLFQAPGTVPAEGL